MNELTTTASPGLSLYAAIYNAVGQVWNGTAFVTPDNAAWASYVVAMADPSHTGDYAANFPVAITVPGEYAYTVRIAGNPVSSADQIYATGIVNWDGRGKVVTPSNDDLITLDYYQTFIGNTTSSKASQRQALISAASDAARAYCGCELKASTRTDLFDGTGTDYLTLAAKPIASIDNITLGVSSINPVVIAGANFIWNAAGTVVFNPQWNGDRGFPAGFQNIRVVYTAGYNPIPNDLQLAVALIVQALESIGSLDPNVTSKTVRDVKVSYGPMLAKAVGGDLSHPIFAGASAILNRYVRPVCI